MSKFCNKCHTLLDIKTLPNSEFYFECVCGQQIQPQPEDTLLYERTFESIDTSQKYEIYITTAKDDVAAYRIQKTCDQCKSPIMLLVRTGENERTFYVCKKCDNVINH